MCTKQGCSTTVFSTAASLSEHVARCHSGRALEKKKCWVCGKKYSRVRAHIQSHPVYRVEGTKYTLRARVGDLTLSDPRGVSIVAGTDIPRGTTLGLYANGQGTVVTRALLKSLKSSYVIGLCGLGPSMYALDADTPESRYPFAYINSGCYSKHANCSYSQIRDTPQVEVKTTRDIRAGEELLFNYRCSGFMQCVCTYCKK